MEKIIKDLGLDFDNTMEGIIAVTGNNDKLKELRGILNEVGYDDDSFMAPILSGMLGMELITANETIGTILINTVMGCGYLALENVMN